MQKKIDQHVFQGMQRDMSISKQKAEFLWDANNIRLTARHDDTLFSMTNERGTKEIALDKPIKGVVLGYCVLGDYLTVFTTNCPDDINKPDCIYRIHHSASGFKNTLLYNGNLGFKVDHPIECLGVYENVDIQKIYWTDGSNQPRFINITADDNVVKSYIDTSFDFVPTLELKDSISIKKVADSSGIFAAGMIQYAVTYYNKYGQESNISVVSPLIATSYTSRAGGPEDTVGNAFKITVKNPDTNFEYLRLYSIFRSSKDTTPVCKRIADVKLGTRGDVSSQFIMQGNEGQTRYARVSANNVQFKLKYSDEEYSRLLGSPYLENKEANVNGVLFEANRYYHFSRDLCPELIIKTKVYNDSTHSFSTTETYFTWDTCTDIYISTYGVSGPGSSEQQLMYSDGGNPSLMRYADQILYTTEAFTDDASVTVTDNGTIGEDVDYNELLFVGGEEITAGTITQKDGTMFLGDIKIKRPQLKGTYSVTSGIDGYEKKTSGTLIIKTITGGTTIECSNRTCYIPLTMNSESYQWGNSLNATSDIDGEKSTNTAGFKWGDHYRLGLQFQYKTGKWSQPVFIADMKMTGVDNKPSLRIEGNRFIEKVPSFTAKLNSKAGDKLLANGYKRVRAVVCFPTESDQLILCQGLLNPTVHSIAGRLNHTPDVQSSWYFRPVPTTNDVENDIPYPQYKDKWTLFSGKRSGATTYIPTRHDEIQGSPIDLSNIPISEYFDTDTYELNNPITINPHIGNITGDDLNHTVTDSQDLTNVFVVDWEYLTFHSPEFEFNDIFRNIDTTTIKHRLIGKQLVSSNQGDIHIITSTATISTDAPGFYHKVVQSLLSAYRINAELFYRDSRVAISNGDPGDFIAKQNQSSKVTDYDNHIESFLVYPWHRTGSLNNDCVRPYDKGSRTSVLSQKKIINLMYFSDTAYDNKYENIETDIKIFNSDQVALTKINNKNYFGNIDQVLSPCCKYGIGFSDQHPTKFSSDLKYVYETTSGPWSTVKPIARGLFASSDPVYIKYKSTPHAVLHTSYDFSNLTPGEQPYLFCAEMYREPQDSDFGGTSAMAIHNNLWYPAGPAVEIKGRIANTIIPFLYGDTYYQRYDCLKTYPFTDEDTNSIIEIGSFMVETRINLDGRYDKSRGDISNFMLNPTVFNLINPVYSQKDNFFNYRILDEDYYELSNYPTMVTWTGYKNNAAEVDSWTNITLASTLEMDGTKGKVNAVRVNSDQLYCFQDDAVGQILFNSRVQISPSDGVPIEISNNYKVDGNRYISTSIGCKNKWSIAESVDGLYFIDANTKALYQLNQGQIKPVSTPLNMSYWFMQQDCSTPWLHHYRIDGYMPDQQGIRCFYDNANADLYICTSDKTLCYSEKLGQFVSFLDYHHPIGMFNIDSDYYALNYPDDETSTDIRLWEMFKGKYNTFFDKVYQTDLTFISNENPLNDKIFGNIELRGDFRYWPDNMPQEDFNSPDHQVDHNKMFDTVRVWNEYQDTGEIDLTFKQDVPSNMKKKFRIWRMDIPRDKDNQRQRIRNTWSKVKFTMNTIPDILYDMEIHDIGVVYYL